MRPGTLARDAARFQAEIDHSRQRLAGLLALATTILERHSATTVASLDQNLAALTDLAARWYPIEQRGWDDPAWPAWSGPTDPARPRQITVGQLREVRTGAMLGVPALVPGPGSGRPIIVRSPEDQAAAIALLQSLLVRLLLAAGPVRTTLIDPGGRGASFPLAACLPDGPPLTGDLDELIEEARAVGPDHRLVVIADFPGGYDRRTLAALRSLFMAAPASGVDLLVHVTGPDGIAELPDAVTVDLGELPAPVVPGSTMEVEVVFDAAPPAEMARLLLGRVAHASRAGRTLPWADLAHPPEDHWWREEATNQIKAPLGRQGDGEPLEVHFGVDGPDARLCAHGVVVAMTGAGKTALFHSLIASLAVRYSPDELQLYLLDGKSGVGFAGYRGLPHAAVISLRTRPDVARSVLADLLEEMERRHEVFKRHGVEHFAAYRTVGSPEGHLPRILLVADEFQLLFEDDRQGRAAADLLRLSEQARSAGIHLLLGSQHFAPAAMTHRNLIFANLHLRLALQMAAAEVKAAADFGPAGRRLIAATCTRSGRVVANDAAGDDTANHAAVVAYLDDGRRADLVSALARRRARVVDQVVLDGDGQPDLASNPLLDRLAEAAANGPEALRRLAEQGVRDGGLGCADWTSAEEPVALVVGQAFSVRGQAVAVLRRRRHEHLCIVGESHAERTATVAAAVTSACVQLPPDRLVIRLIDRSLPGTPWSSAIRDLTERARIAGYPVDLVDDDAGAARVLTSVVDELDRRRGPSDPTVLVVLVDVDRVAPLARVPDAYGLEDSELGTRLGRLLDEGGSLGVHVLASFTTVGAARTVLADRRLQAVFRHRVAMQMSDDDSFTMVGSPAASRLQADAPRPVAAVLFDRQNNQGQVFKPFAPGPDRPLGVGR